MICFKDKAFTRNPKCDCDRKLSDEVIAAAVKWWGAETAPIQVNGGCSKCIDKEEK